MPFKYLLQNNIIVFGFMYYPYHKVSFTSENGNGFRPILTRTDFYFI